MVIGERLREIRESKDLSQVDIEKRSGLLRCYLSRVENGHTVPSVETLERLARAMEVPIYKLFYAGREPAKVPDLPKPPERTPTNGEVPATTQRCSPNSKEFSVVPIPRIRGFFY